MQLGTSSVQVGLGSTWSIISAGLILNFWVMSNAHEATQPACAQRGRVLVWGERAVVHFYLILTA